MISTLLATNLSLSKTELAEKAGISTQSVRNHLPTLVAMGLVDETEGQCRLNLFQTRARTPQADSSIVHADRVVHSRRPFETLEALDELTEEVIEIWVQCGPNGLLDIDRLHTMYDWVDWVRPLLSSLTEERDETVQTLSIGPEIAQQPSRRQVRFVIELTFGNMFVICVVSGYLVISWYLLETVRS